MKPVKEEGQGATAGPIGKGGGPPHQSTILPWTPVNISSNSLIQKDTEIV